MADQEFTAELWRWTARDEQAGGGAWFFVSLPFDLADEIEAAASPGGFGSVRVEVRVGATTWRTSVFPSAEERTYVLPVKKAVRGAEGLVEGGPCTVHLRTL